MTLPPTRSAAALGFMTSSLLALSLMSSSATAAVITFEGLTGATADPLTTPYSEDGFTVTPTLGEWKKGLIFGNPLPSIYVSELGPDTPFGNLQITSGGGLFTFNSLDLQAFNTAVGYEIRGSRGGTVLFSVANSQAASANFQTLTGGGSLTIDTLTFDISGGPGSFNVDNINVTAVPEPSAYLLLLSGLGLAAWLRRQKA